MITRREAAEKVFDYIRKNNFIPINIQYSDRYDTVHFNIKGLHGWKFAMWINTNKEQLKNENGDDYPAIQFFCQHELNIDKFKPSRSFFCVNYDIKQIETENNWEFYEIKDILQIIKRHPFIAFTMDCYGYKYYNESYILCYLDVKLYRIKRKLKEWLSDTFTRIWHGSKVWFINRYKVVDKAELIDGNDGYWKLKPRYNMRIHFKVISDDEDKQQRAEINMLDLWFRKNNYNNMILELTRDGINGRYSYSLKE